MRFLDIFAQVIAPILFLVAVGFVMDRKFRMDLPTLSKLNFYVFVPALIFVKLFTADVDAAEMSLTAGFTALHLALLFLICWAAFSVRPLRPQRNVLSLGAIFYNCGNYGIPLVILAFGDDLLGPLAIIIMVQNLFNFTFGLYLLQQGKRSLFSILRSFAAVPTIYAIIAALLLRYFKLTPWPAVYEPLNFLSNGLVSIALITLGAQLSRSLSAVNLLPLSAVSAARLLLSPLLAAVLAPLLGFEGPLAAMLIVIAGTPVAVNVYILAAEYNEDPALASQSIFWTTVLSPITLTILLALLT